MECAGTSNSICYSTGKFIGNNWPVIFRVDFSNLITSNFNNFANYSSTGVHLSSVNAIADEELIVAGFDVTSSPHAHIFFRINMTAATQSWAKTVAPLGK